MRLSHFRYSAILATGLATGLSCTVSGLLVQSVQAEENPTLTPPVVNGPVYSGPLNDNAATSGSVWTQERMNAARPPQMPLVEATAGKTVSLQDRLKKKAGARHVAYPAWNPESGLPQPGLEPTVDEPVDLSALEKEIVLAGNSTQTIGSPPSDPTDHVDYGPFQRWTWFGRYTTFPTSVHGKLFVRLNDTNIVCSGTVVNRSMVYTAGHCINDGNGKFAESAMFCPSYNAGGVNPTRGCWDAGAFLVTSGWHNSGDVDRDVGCVLTESTGTIISDHLGDVTGWVGLQTISFTLASALRHQIFSFGYPGQTPFPGHHIIAASGILSYDINNNADSWATMYIGSDMNAGADGGGWLISMRHNTAEYPPVDTSQHTNRRKSSATSGPYLVGVNAHRRCMNGDCSTPPTAMAGLFWNEWGSPEFVSGADTDDPHDLYNACIAAGGGG